MSNAINTLEFKQLVFNEIYHRYEDPKALRRAFSFLEAAIQCFYKKGFEAVTLTMIAREAGVTRQLLNHYFSDLREIQELSMMYIRVIGQKLMLKEIENEKDPSKILFNYLNAHYLWANQFKTHVRVWLNFLAYCAKKDSFRLINSKAILTGRNRIEQILREGRESGLFKHLNDKNSAILIQTIIGGWLVALLSEEVDDEKEYSKTIIQECMKCIGIYPV